ncbi:hypothetical protein EJ03DRAFT_107012 [Teratosphaeria nubilosa]|uniref:Uncharacterized protein n=1 Tax=Teratosphaeria nubilosa TaxID=161662 RepID=A0A6G1L850_9PEZI|nr:hypothetical protein EJ03DRAFT_107012 [Teratosphaeria nubilosa]
MKTTPPLPLERDLEAQPISDAQSGQQGSRELYSTLNTILSSLIAEAASLRSVYSTHPTCQTCAAGEAAFLRWTRPLPDSWLGVLLAIALWNLWFGYANGGDWKKACVGQGTMYMCLAGIVVKLLGMVTVCLTCQTVLAVF